MHDIRKLYESNVGSYESNAIKILALAVDNVAEALVKRDDVELKNIIKRIADLENKTEIK